MTEQYRKTFMTYDETGREYGKWLTVEKDGSPPDLEVVIVEYSGDWPHLSASGGIIDLYWYGDDWFNYPESAKIKRWMWIPR